MDRPVRRSRQRLCQTGVVGLLPQEEAAINRALYESLLEEKKKTPPKHQQLASSSSSSSSSSAPEGSTTHTPSRTGPASSILPEAAACSTSRRSPAASPEVMETDKGQFDPVEGTSGSKTPPKIVRLNSPLSSSQSLDSSCESKPSSPIQTGMFAGGSSSSVSSPLSVESSLKLVLSTSSWSCSSSSSWTPSPEPVSKAGPKPKNKARLRSKVNTAKIERTIKAANEGVKQKGKRGRPRKYPTDPTKTLGTGSKGSSTTPKASKATKSYTKSSKQHNTSSTKSSKKPPKTEKTPKSNKIKQELVGSELDLAPMSPEAALVLHDHCYLGSDNYKAPEQVNGSSESKFNSSSPYPVQRKFAHNQLPVFTPPRPATDEVESAPAANEVPKTEDFIKFLCLRGSERMPKELEKFAIPWTPLQRRKGSKNGHKVCIRRRMMPFVAVKGTKSKLGNVAKKLDPFSSVSAVSWS